MVFAEFQHAIEGALLAGAALDAIEDKIINRAPLDEEQQSALWLYAQALADRPARLMPGEREFVGLGA